MTVEIRLSIVLCVGSLGPLLGIQNIDVPSFCLELRLCCLSFSKQEDEKKYGKVLKQYLIIGFYRCAYTKYDVWGREEGGGEFK